MCFSKKSLDILKFYKEEQNINSIAKNFNTTYNIIRNNYFKPFYKQRYLRKTKKGHYILSTKGIIKIKKVEKQHLIEKSILKLAKEQKSNKEIINFISEKFNQDITNSSIYSKIYRKRKKNNIKRRNTNKINIPKKFSTNLAQFLGLFFSDGSYSKYDVCFYNTCQPLINKFIFLTQNIFKLENPCTRLKPSGAVEARFGSVHLSDFIFSLIGKKQKLPDKIINGSIKLKKAFLKGYFSGDGGVCLSISLESRRKKRLIFSSNIFISCKPLKIRKELAHLLTSIGYNPTIGSSSIIISRKDNLSKFYNEINKNNI